MNMKKLMTIIGLLLSLGAAAQIMEDVQTDSTELLGPERYEQSWYFTSSFAEGLFWFGTGHANMNALLERQGLSPSIWSSSLYINGGVRFLNRAYADLLLAIPLWGLGNASESVEFGGNQISIDDYRSHISLNLGYALVQSRNMSLILRAGIGWVGREVRIVEYEQVPFNFDNFNQPSEARVWPILYHQSGVGDVSIEFLQGRPKRPLSVSPSLRAGFLVGFNSRAWETGGSNLTVNAPSDRTQSFYIAGGITIFLNREKKDRR